MNEICCENECQVSFTMAGKAWGTHDCLNHILAGLGWELTTSGPQHTGLGSLDWAPPPLFPVYTRCLPCRNQQILSCYRVQKNLQGHPDQAPL